MIHTIGKEVYEFSALVSTNNYANSILLTESPINGSVISTVFQTGGKGQRGNSWESEKEKNLLFSVIIYPENVEASNQFDISIASSLAVQEFYSKYLNNVTVKWPNDIYVDNKKICGMLIENQITGMHVSSSVIGIGMNINQEKFYSDAPNPTSLFIETGNSLGRTEALTEICQLLSKYFTLMEEDPEQLFHLYISTLFQKGEWCLYNDEKGTFEGMIVGVTEFGQLVVADRGGENRIYNFKEIQYIIDN